MTIIYIVTFAVIGLMGLLSGINQKKHQAEATKKLLEREAFRNAHPETF